MLLECPLDKAPLCRSLDVVLGCGSENELGDVPHLQPQLASCIPTLFKLMSSAKDRAILTFVLSSIFSTTSLTLTLGLQNSQVTRVKEKLNDILNDVSSAQRLSEEEAQRQIESTISKLEIDLVEKEGQLNSKRPRLAEEEIEVRSFQLETKRKRLHRLQGSSKHVIKKRLSNRLFHKWKQSLLSQKGKNKGCNRIDRSAELVLYEVLQEQLKAHRRRWGEENTGYLEHEHRIQSKEMLRIANDHLRKQGKKPIQSKETVRSWGKCKNKRYRQAQQHRGRSLWAHLRPQKKYHERHINIHYNRAHIKNYVRFAFGKNSNVQGKNLVIRRAIDDKAFIRCGTSEGFSRPLHNPLHLNDGPDCQFQLPSSDYPDSVGCVSPGVILMVNDMKEVELKGRDKFVATDVTVSVTCKPKHIYPSSATNWANDLAACRYRFRNEHEVPSTSESKNNISNKIPYLVAKRDSLFQFELMTIKEDYEKVVEGGDHLSRELLRVEVLLKRINVCLMETAEDLKQESVIGKVFADLSLLADQLKDIGTGL